MPRQPKEGAQPSSELPLVAASSRDIGRKSLLPAPVRIAAKYRAFTAFRPAPLASTHTRGSFIALNDIHCAKSLPIAHNVPKSGAGMYIASVRLKTHLLKLPDGKTTPD